MESQLSQFIHKHTFIVAAVPPYKERQQKWILSHWNHHSGGKHLHIQTEKLSLDDLQHVLGFREAGSISIPPSQYELFDWHVILSSMESSAVTLTNSDSDSDSDCNSTAQRNITQLKGIIQTKESPSSNSITLNLYAIEAFTRAEDGLGDCSNLDEVVWKWSKPESPYRKSGFLYTTAEEAIHDGVWNVGRGFRLLVEKVGILKKKIMFREREMPLMIISDETARRDAYLVEDEDEV